NPIEERDDVLVAIDEIEVEVGQPGDPHQRLSLKTAPPFITQTTRCSSVMSRSGSPATATTSANFPRSIVPARSLHPMISAAIRVAEAIASIGDWPSLT